MRKRMSVYFSGFDGFLMCKTCLEIPKLIFIKGFVGITFAMNTNLDEL